MERNLWSLDLNTLKSLHDAEAEELQKALLGGQSWEETKGQRQKVTELAIAIHKIRLGGQHPAGHDLRNRRC